MTSFRIAGHTIGDDAPVFIIAELSANHGGSRDVALRSVEAAARAGANAIKLQTYTPDTLTLKSDTAPFVVKTKNAWAGRTLHDLYAEAMTPWEWHAEIKAAAEAAGLVCFSTPFDATAAMFLEKLGVPAYKIASFEMIDLPLIERVARFGRPMIISTGMATLGDIESAVAVCREAGNDQIALLRCVSCYPADPASMNLTSYEALRSFGTVLGLSDHTRDSTVAVASVALGARLIEKHFILDRSVGGPDSFFSLEPSEFRSLVDAVRMTEAAMGPPRFGPAPDERASTAFRRSLFVARDVAAGTVLTCDDVRSVRPANGLHPRHLPEVLGRTAASALRAGTPLRWDLVGPGVTGPAIELRAATAADSDALLAWRNDPVTRSMSFHADVVSADAHAKWFAGSVDSRDRLLLVAEIAGQRVGVVRLDARGHDTWEISLTVAPAERGHGYAAAMLVAGERVARERGVRTLTARIRPMNEASVKAFKRAGYYSFADDPAEAERTLSCERRIAPYT